VIGFLIGFHLGSHLLAITDGLKTRPVLTPSATNHLQVQRSWSTSRYITHEQL